MSASYPASLKSFSSKSDGPGNTIFAVDVNGLQDEVVAIESGLLNGLAHGLKPTVAAAQDLGTSALPWGQTHTRVLALDAASTLTIASGVVTIARSYHAIDTEGAAATDDLDTLTASAVSEGTIVVLRAANVAHVVTVKDGTGNLLLNGDCALSTTDATLSVIYDGTNWREIARSVTAAVANDVVVLNKSTTEQEVVSSTVETSVFSYAVPAGTLSTSKCLRLTVPMSYLNNSGGADTFTLRVKFGGTTIASSAISLGASANRRTLKLVTEINANGATNSQRAVSAYVVGGGAAENTFDAPVSQTQSAYNGSLALDSTGALTLTVTIQHGTSAATISLKRFSAVLELLG